MCISPASSCWSACHCSSRHLLHNHVLKTVGAPVSSIRLPSNYGSERVLGCALGLVGCHTVAQEGQEGHVTDSGCQEVRGKHHWCDEHQTSYAPSWRVRLPRHHSHPTMSAEYFRPTVVKMLGNRTPEEFLRLPCAARADPGEAASAGRPSCDH